MTAQSKAEGDDAADRQAHEVRRSHPVARWVRLHPIVSFLVWFFTIGWAIAFIPVVAKSWLGLDLPFQPFVIASTC